MKKRLLSLLLILCLCAALLPAAVSAEDNVIELNQTKLDGLLGEATQVNPNLNAYSYENPLPAGSYRLADDVVLRASIVIEGNVTLDLNAKSITRDIKYSCGAFRVIGKEASLTLMDSSEEQSGAIDLFGGGMPSRWAAVCMWMAARSSWTAVRFINLMPSLLVAVCI